MTLQQLQYVIAVDKHRSFAAAADSCGVTQPTLSKMIANLEEELDVRIFDRSSRRVEPTSIGRRIIAQAGHALREAARIREIVADTKTVLSGRLAMAVGPSIAPYILPQFIRVYSEDYPAVALKIEEQRPENMFASLLAEKIDMAIAAGGGSDSREGILEIPLYTEPFWVYLSESCLRSHPAFTPADLSHESMWVMKEAQCLRESAFSFCKARDTGRRVYEAGNIETLVRVVDANGGFTIIPESVDRMTVMNSAPGGFFVFGCLMAGCVWLERKLNKPIERKSCGDVMLEKIDAAKEEQKEGAAQ